MKFVIDMNLSPDWVDVIADAGFSAVHWHRIGKANDPDEAIMEFARAHGFVVLTHDLDFSAILARSNIDRPSVVQMRTDNLDPTVNGPALIAALRACAADLERGALVTIDPHRYRLRVLPLRGDPMPP